MADFKDCIDVILEHEGGFVDDPDDPGGPTNYGLSSKWLRRNGIDLDGDGILTVREIKLMSIEKAKEVYWTHIWDKLGLGRIVDTKVATKVFDMVVNMGEKWGFTLLQRAVNDREWVPPLIVDGKLGPATLSAVNCIPPERLLPEIKREHALYYKTLVRLKPQFEKFLAGWLQRASYPA
jgi:lysozyme family protein